MQDSPQQRVEDPALCAPDLKVVHELLRHKDIRMTQRYSHLSPGYLRQASLTLDKTFANLCVTVPLLPQLPLVAATIDIHEILGSTKAT